MAERVWVTKSQSSLRLSGFHSSLLLIHFRFRSDYLFTLHKCVTEPICYVSQRMWLSIFEIGAAQLRSVTEIAPKSPFLWVLVFVSFSCRRKSYPVYCEHSLRLDSRKPSDWFASHPCLHSCVEIMTGRTILCADSTSPGTLRNHDGDGNENARKATGLMSKTTILHVHRAFLYISLPSLHNYDVKWQNFKFTWEPRTARR